MAQESLTIKKLKCGTNLKRGFETLLNNNTIEFSNHGIAIVYGPNGTGKTSISRIFLGEKNTEAEIEYAGKKYTDFEKEPLFHVIKDQNNRNIIEGNTDEFILGDNIQKERLKKEELDQAQQAIFDSMKDKLKKTFLITKKTAVFVESITNETLKSFLDILSKTGSKQSDLTIETLESTFQDKPKHAIPSYNDEQYSFFTNDVNKIKKDSIIYAIQKIAIEKIQPSPVVRVIGRNTDAISILNRYKDIHQCIVCDTPNIKPMELLHAKEIESEKAKLTLNQETKKILENIIQNVEYHKDPFNIHEILSNAIETGEAKQIIDLCSLLGEYQDIEEQLLENDLLEIYTQSPIHKIYAEYTKMVNSKIELENADELLIKFIISESMSKNIELKRDEQKNIIIKFEGKNLLGESRESLPLSAGEQNFISLSFELLKAKNKEAPIIVLDDPISSFDSIFKNKIAFCIVKFLEKKQVLIFTHNIDLIRLLNVQIQHCYNLYLLCNETEHKCGFIAVENKEREFLLYLDKLLQFLRGNEIELEITNKKLYIMSLLPFMRGIIKILNPKNLDTYYKQLSEIMHGCNTSPIDVVPIYNELFGKNEQEQVLLIPDDFLDLDIENLSFLREGAYPLFSKTLKHTLTYLYLRLRVENTLKETFPNETKNCTTLGDFIHRALNKQKYLEERSRLSSMKTLLNEFNHYEGNFNIFQPAIDISDESLAQEKQRIEGVLADIISKASSSNNN